MAWYKVDDRLPTSRKVLRIPRERRVAAIGVWTLAGAWSAHDLTDGFIPAYMIEEWGGCETDADALVEAGLWERAEDDGDAGFQFVNWGEYQPLKADVEAYREREREKKRRQRRDSNGKFAGQSTVPRVSPGDSGGTPLGLPTDDGGESAVPDPARPDAAPWPGSGLDFELEGRAGLGLSFSRFPEGRAGPARSPTGF